MANNELADDDDDIQNLLNQLVEPFDKVANEPQAVEPEPVVVDKPQETTAEIILPDNPVPEYPATSDEDDDEGEEITADQIIGAVEEQHDIQVVSQSKQPEKKNEPVVALDVNKIIAQHERDYQEALDNTRKDRVTLGSVISNLLAKIDINAAVPPKIGDVESLVRACDALSTTNLNIIKMMDSRSKLIVALKGQISSSKLETGPSKQTEHEDKLEDMLRQPEDEV